MIKKLAFAISWCKRASEADTVVTFLLMLLGVGIIGAWIVPAWLISMSGQYVAFVYWPFISAALTAFLVIPPYLLLAPRLFVWDGQIVVKESEVQLDLTRFANPADFAQAKVNERAKWQGTPCLLTNGGGPFHGRIEGPTVSTQSYYRAMHKPDLLRYAQGKPSRWRDVSLSLLVVMGLGALFIGLLAVAE